MTINLQEWKEKLRKGEDEEQRLLEQQKRLANYLEKVRNLIEHIEQAKSEGQEILASSEFAEFNKKFEDAGRSDPVDPNDRWYNSVPALAERIILERGPLHAKALKEEAKKHGHDMTAHHLASKLRRRPNRFTNLGGNVWDVVNRSPVAPPHKNGVPHPTTESSINYDHAPVESPTLN